ncbi:hypothetical protein [Bradyrhizobium sp. 174]|uniref:hypothetical protein n=1 Tax=Bradyrhizobium sp. 174 TaxID=2782645 RepID=UPI001FFB9929|nr:hypothetical protein [Bradyrhizobium sp. 174]MCK1577817.1 hypothetical protein [Bradyrhizobium sp. 174]
MRVVVSHDGPLYRAESWGFRGSCGLLHKPSGRYAVMTGADARRYRDATDTGLFEVGVYGDDLYGWLWTNAGFHRFTI